MAKVDKNGQSELTTAQYAAIDLLVSGLTDQAVADTLGKSRQAVCGWRLYHPTFKAVLNQRRAEIWSAAADRLRALLPVALQVLEEELQGVNRLRAAVAIARLAAIPVQDIGPTDPHAFAVAEAQAQEAQSFATLTGPNLADVYQELVDKATAETNH